MQDRHKQSLTSPNNNAVTGEFIDFDGDRYYAIRNVDRMTPFFVSVVSNVDHWLFTSSTGGVTAGRISPDFALFPYTTVDKIHESTSHTGSKTLLRMTLSGIECTWEPFKLERSRRYQITRSLYKNSLGNKICFEEVNHDLKLAFRYSWLNSEKYGFVRRCELENQGDTKLAVELVDGLQNLLPAGTPRFAQTNSSNLVDAYKWTELDEASGLALYTLYSGITDRAEPSESLRANTVFCLGLDEPTVLISSEQLNAFRAGEALESEARRRGVRGAYFVNQTLELKPKRAQRWQFVADVEQDQTDVVALLGELESPQELEHALDASIAAGSDELARIMAGADAFQATAEENVVEHHYANVLFNVLRGGTFDDQYSVRAADFADTIHHFNREVYENNKSMLLGLPGKLSVDELAERVASAGDHQLERLRREYLPIFFGRRHGDPSRPWNEFAIHVSDDRSQRILSYQGNWRDIFQNWEALALSYPEYIENIIAKFVNASTMDGYNPYRITKQGIDWEVEELDNPWSFIGYWGDHQIIYLQKFLELSRGFHPQRLAKLLREPVYCYANVPYRIKSFAYLLIDSKSTVVFDDDLAALIDTRVERIGADGKLILNGEDRVYQVNLLEKLLVPLLAKLGNFALDGGIWLNTQRPEWNDANNALVGQGLSMITLCYLRRYLQFLQDLIAQNPDSFELSEDVATWLAETNEAFASFRPLFNGKPIAANKRYELFEQVGLAACRYRKAVYKNSVSGRKTEQKTAPVLQLIDDALRAVDHSIGTNLRDDGLYNAYNLMHVDDGSLNIDTLYPMLEGQVAALSAGAIGPSAAVKLIDALFDSEVYRADQQSFMLYPDRKLQSFLQKNRIPEAAILAIPLLQTMIENADDRLVQRDARGDYRFNADFNNVGELDAALEKLDDLPEDVVLAAREPLHQLYEDVFKHKKFTGRSGGMFGFEGLGSIYWHMVAKLLLAVQENYFNTLDSGCDETTLIELGKRYYRIRQGIGFNKTPVEYGAFPTDPYSHTPKHAGARQPGMTGQVKEEILTRFGELGLRIKDGCINFEPRLLREQEFRHDELAFRYLNIRDEWQTLTVPAGALAFTWCQVPIVYELAEDDAVGLTIFWANGEESQYANSSIPDKESQEFFSRSGNVQKVQLRLSAKTLFDA